MFKIKNGIPNLFKSGLTLAGRHLPGFDQWCTPNFYWVFTRAFPFALCDEKYWYRPKRDLPWEAFEPYLDQMDTQRRQLFAALIRIILCDETVAPWKPKKSELGGAPHLVYIPSKPGGSNYGALLRNACEALTGITTTQEIVKDAEIEDKKAYTGEESHMPDKSKIKAHVGEDLRLAEASGLVEGDLEGGDAHFGSVEAVVELKSRLGVYSIFNIKENNASWYPMAPLKRVLNARHGRRRQGKWAVMTTTVSGVEVMALAYCWHSSGNPSFFVSSCGSSQVDPDSPKETQIETGIGTITTLVPRPKLCSFFQPLLSIVDEHNQKHCKQMLPLYQSWPTRFFWWRLILCILGQSIVDELHAFKWKDPENYQEMSPKEFCEHIVPAGTLRPWPRTNIRGPTAHTRQSEPLNTQLIRIQGPNGDINHEVTAHDAALGRNVGRARNNSCWMCRKYYRKYKPTPFCCRQCGTPLCNKDRTGDIADDGSVRNQSCKHEHFHSPSPEIRCGGNGQVKKSKMSNYLKVYD